MSFSFPVTTTTLSTTEHISSVVGDIQEASEVAIGEYQKVVSIRKATSEATAVVQKKAKKLFKDIDILSLDDIMTFVSTLTALRKVRGELLGVKELRYADIGLVDTLEIDAEEKNLQLEILIGDFYLMVILVN